MEYGVQMEYGVRMVRGDGRISSPEPPTPNPELATLFAYPADAPDLRHGKCRDGLHQQ